MFVLYQGKNLKRLIRKTLCVLFVLCFGSSSFADASGWIEYRAPGYLVFSDRPENKVIRFVSLLAQFDSAARLLLGLHDRTNNEEPVHIYYFDSKSQFSDYANRRTTKGFYFDDNGQPIIVVGPTNADHQLVVLLHEYVHYLVALNADSAYPRWYNEGMAEVLSTAKVEGDTVVFGFIPEMREQWLKRRVILPVEDLLVMQPVAGRHPEYIGRYYASAWLFSHYLSFGYLAGEPDHRKAIAGFLTLLNHGADDFQAFQVAFGQSTKDMDGNLKRYARNRTLPGLSVKVPNLKVALEARALSAPDMARRLSYLAWGRSDFALSEQLLLPYLNSDVLVEAQWAAVSGYAAKPIADSDLERLMIRAQQPEMHELTYLLSEYHYGLYVTGKDAPEAGRHIGMARQLIDMHPLDPASESIQSLYLRVKIYFVQEDFRSLVQPLQQLVERVPGSWHATLLAARIMKAMQNPDYTRYFYGRVKARTHSEALEKEAEEAISLANSWK
ncbi:hypothetical protein [Simiduia agarivorans]|nr:hypothetical protein [Simiduia agarivorans]